MTHKHHVKFIAHEKVKEPVVVSFKTRDGEKVKFAAHEKVLEKVPVNFMAKNKKG
jgi:hypothetical protein